MYTPTFANIGRSGQVFFLDAPDAAICNLKSGEINIRDKEELFHRADK
jgi:hypothetical protein